MIIVFLARKGTSMQTHNQVKRNQIETFLYYLCLSSLIWIGLAFLLSANAKAQMLIDQNITPIEGWQSPRLPENKKSILEKRFQHLDPDNIVPRRGLKQALQFFVTNESQFKNKRFITIIDYARHSSEKRLFLINLETGNSGAFYVAHGKGSDSNHDGYADRFSDKHDSLMTSLGFFMTGDTYEGKHGLTMRLNGVSKSNDSAAARAIVFHGADYVGEEFDTLGRSFGCPAIEQRNVEFLISRIAKGSLFYAWFDELYERPEKKSNSDKPVPADQQH